MTYSSQILGRAIKNEYLALGTILGTAGIVMASMGGSKKAAPASEGKPSIQSIKDSVKFNASSRSVSIAFPRLFLEFFADALFVHVYAL